MDDRIFDKQSASYWSAAVEGESGRGKAGGLYPRLNAWLDLASPSEILDIGPGQGACSGNISLEGRNYTGIEPSLFLLERSREGMSSIFTLSRRSPDLWRK